MKHILYRLIFCLGLISSLNSYGQQDSLKVGQLLPDFSLTTPEGRILKNNVMKGKVLVLDFWANWCMPCKKLTKEVDAALKHRHGTAQFQMIGVLYREFKTELALKYWQEAAYRFPMAWDNNSLGKTVIAGNPTLLVVDKKGFVRGRWDMYKPEIAAEVGKLVEILVAEK